MFKKKITLLVLNFVLSIGVYAQNFHLFTVGTSLTYIWNHNKYYNVDYDEFTWNLNTAVNITRKISIGVQALSIFANERKTEYEYYHIVGGFLQYYFPSPKSINFFIESSINMGDFYFPENEYPSKLNRLKYLGLGSGVELMLKKGSGLFLELSFVSYQTLFPPKKCNAFTQYIVGINYKFAEIKGP